MSIGLVLFSCTIAVAAPPLTTVQDILYKADGSRFEGIATISWQSFQAVDSTTIAAKTITTKIVNGFIRVRLVPTTNAITPASYTVVYNSDGNAQFAESWIVPPSNVPVRIREVRVGDPGTVIGGTPIPPIPITSAQISDILGLTAALNIRPSLGTGFTPSRAAVINQSGAIDGALGNLLDCVHVDGTAGPCGATGPPNPSTGFVDGETPAGAIDGTNQSFVLSNTPNPPASLELFRNGLLQQQGLDYSLSGGSLTFLTAQVPSRTDLLVASYRVGASIPGVGFVDAEIPSGGVLGVNLAYTLSKTPSPAASLDLYLNGVRLKMDVDYMLSGGRVILFQPGTGPQPGQTLLASYRIAQ
ncbi:MAG: hypothetical protein ACR2NN_21725 [Bryobacteraceae bacterium]